MSDTIDRLNAALEGRYEVEREIGEGGMATVFLAKDLKHNRNVALKVLKPELAAVVGAERFLAEIETTANLQHPHILPLFDSGEADSFLFYVMPYVEGETLRDRLDKDHQLPVDDAVQIATNVAEALDYAHSQGVIHRDIKPANILLQAGKPVISDFGIALAVGAAGGGRLTETGLSLGTPHYMSPEQATGDLSVGAASDTYALGCVLYEMLVGEPPYTGSTAQAILGKIIAGKLASATGERASVPRNVDAAIRKALEKVPADRFTGAQEFAKALADPGFRYGLVSAAGARVPAVGWNRLTVVFGIVAVAASAVASWALLRPAPTQAPGVAIRAEVNDLDLSGSGWKVAVSPDSRWIVAGHRENGQNPALYIRRADNLDWRRLANTGGGIDPTFSPNGEWVAFNVDGGVRKVPITGGPALPIATGGGPHWASDDVIVYQSGGDIYRVSASGGEPEVLFESDSISGVYPRLLPNGEAVVFSTVTDGDPLTARVMLVEIETGAVRELAPSGNNPSYLPTGHVIYGHGDQALMGVPFDLETLQVTGSQVVLLPDLIVRGGGASAFAVSETGTLVYDAPTYTAVRSRTPVWVERDGTAREIDPSWQTTAGLPSFSSLALSPNGNRLAISLQDSDGSNDLWVKPLDTGPESRLTFEGSLNTRATWRDDQSLTFISNRAGEQDLWAKPADGSGSAEVVLDTDGRISEAFYSPDGEWLVYREGDARSGGNWDIFAIRAATDGEPVPLVVNEFTARSPTVSPDGRWLAYVSDEGGAEEVYVRRFPDADSPIWRVSPNGGAEPVWAHSGRELFYRNGADELVAVQVSVGAAFTWDSQESLFSVADYLAGEGHPTYDISPDDQRFVMLKVSEVEAETAESKVIIVTNWFTELRERMGGN